MSKDTGGPAFPRSAGDHNGTKHGNTAQAGMTLRDYFAATALPVCLAECNDFPDENWRVGVALDAYMMADAMLAARGK